MPDGRNKKKIFFRRLLAELAAEGDSEEESEASSEGEEGIPDEGDGPTNEASIDPAGNHFQ